MKSTYFAKKADVVQKWYLLDASGQILGRVAARAAGILRGKHKTLFTPHVDTGDFVIIINAGGVVVTGKKREQKLYRRYSGYPSGLKQRTFDEVMKKDPTQVVMHAVQGMLPKGRLGRAMIKKLKVYAGNEHLHEAQMPEAIAV
ncbi:MAG: 50S ribosomal protein L13 [Candidatus Omnitrophica bacterium]|nr:50S ribosomal protein L13 [Candidatus Omnitrophota bacterium]